jgi:hypothetical protein
LEDQERVLVSLEVDTDRRALDLLVNPVEMPRHVEELIYVRFLRARSREQTIVVRRF